MELVLCLSIAAVAVFAWMALLLLDNHVGTLVDVAVVAAACYAALLVLLWRRWHRPAIRTDPAGLAITVVAGAVGAFFFFPGFHYGVTDKDPGGYIEIGAAFARHASYSFTDVLAQHVPGIVTQSPGARFPAVWQAGPHTVIPQFYHLWPALLAMAYDVGGLRLEVEVTPALGVLSVMAFAALLRRAVRHRAGLAASAVGGLLLATNMLEVWQAKYPTAEMLSQLLIVSALLAIALALDTGWAPAAGLAGLLVGVDWLARADIVLLAAIAVLIGALLVALRRWDSRCWWFVAGLGVTLPHVLWQAYAGADDYTISNGVPALHLLIEGTVGAFAAAVLFRWAARPALDWIAEGLNRKHWQRRGGAVVCVTAVALLAAGFLRPWYDVTHTVISGTRLPTYNEENLRNLSRFLTLPGIALAVAGLASLALRRWRATLWLIAIPALLVAPVYLYDLHNVSRLMPGGRRYVPEVLPGFLILITLALVAGMGWRLRRRAPLRLPAIAAAVGLLVVFVWQSAPLRMHDEEGGSLAVSAALASTAQGRTGVYLFQWKGPTVCCTEPEYLFGGAIWLERGEYSALLPYDPHLDAGYVRSVLAGMPGSPVFVIWDGTSSPPPLARLSLTAVRHIQTGLPVWNESYVARPTGEAVPIPLDFTVWRVTS
ncbi:MAG TPA: hypothetical protein VNG13_02075 [Mycobacteriales bacterium]|nr:hypothetical protein [Mycobacteriales bacterium]